MIPTGLFDRLFADAPGNDFEAIASDILAAVAPGTTSRLYLVDQSGQELRRVQTMDVVPIEGPLRDVALDGEHCKVDSVTWIPVVDGDHVHAMLQVEGAIDGADPAVTSVTQTIGSLIAASRRHTDLFESRRRREDMTVAAEMQWDLLPTPSVASATWKLSCSLEPAYDIAGDVFDHSIDRDGFTAVVLDAMGHGQRAVLAASLALAAVRNGRRDGATLAEAFTQANQRVRDAFDGLRYVTAIGIHAKNDTFEAISAGHPLPWRLTAEGAERIHLDAFLPFGLADGTRYESTRLEGPIDGVLMITDGVTGAKPDFGSAFGTQRVDEIASREKWTEPRRLSRTIIDAVLNHRDGPVQDDVCVYAAIRRS